MVMSYSKRNSLHHRKTHNPYIHKPNRHQRNFLVFTIYLAPIHTRAVGDGLVHHAISGHYGGTLLLHLYQRRLIQFLVYSVQFLDRYLHDFAIVSHQAIGLYLHVGRLGVDRRR